MTRIWTAVAAVGALLPFAALAYPEGAPWTAAGHPSEACASCHFDSLPIEDSPALSVEGLNAPLRAGETYPLSLRFAPEAAEVAGFLASFEGPEGEGGTITPAEGLETNGAAVRSAEVKDVAAGIASWTFDWTAPDTPGLVTLRIAANAANDDASPFGDAIHHKMLEVEVQ